MFNVTVADEQHVDGLQGAELEQAITRLAGSLAAATCCWLLLIGRFNEREQWKTSGCKSAAQWLSWQCGLGPGTAREHLRVAHRLKGLPAIRESFGRGELSYSKVRALTRCATESTETELVEVARHATASHIERIALGYRRAENAEAGKAARQELRRELSWFIDDDGSFVLRGRLTADDGARLVQAIQAAESGVSAGTPVGQRAADGLVVLADAFLGDPSGRAVTLSVEVDAAATPPETLQRLLCDATVQTVTRDTAGVVSNYGRKRRTASKTQKRVLLDRDQGCRFPGCDSQRWLAAHHVKHWAGDHGPTDITNLIMLCSHHNGLVHELGWSINFNSADNLMDVFDPDGQKLYDPACLRGNVGDIDNPAITPDTIRSLWQGETLDLATTVEVLLWRRHHEQPPSTPVNELLPDL